MFSCGAWLMTRPYPIKYAQLLPITLMRFLEVAATAWEIAIKKAIGKLEAPDDLPEAIKALRFEPMPINISHAIKAGSLPRYHNDPFDRMIIAQSILEGLMVVTRDSRFFSYNILILPS